MNSKVQLLGSVITFNSQHSSIASPFKHYWIKKWKLAATCFTLELSLAPGGFIIIFYLALWNFNINIIKKVLFFYILSCNFQHTGWGCFQTIMKLENRIVTWNKIAPILVTLMFISSFEKIIFFWNMKGFNAVNLENLIPLRNPLSIVQLCTTSFVLVS